MLENYFDFSFKLLYLNGLHPRKIFKPLITLNFASTVLILFLCLTKTIMAFDMDQLEEMLILVEIILKQFTFLLAMKKIQITLDDIKHFWDLHLNECKILPKYLKLQTVYIITLMTCLPMLAAKPFVVPGKSLFGCYFPELLPFTVTYLFEVYVFIMAILIVAGQDLLLCFLILMVIEQFHLLNKKLKSLDLSQVRNSYDLQEAVITFKKYVMYHSFLLRYIKKLNGILSRPQLIFMGMSAAILCFSMYNSSINTNSPILKYRIAVISLALLSEFLIIYGYPAQVMMDENFLIHLYCVYKTSSMLESYFDFCFKLLRLSGLHPRKIFKPLYILNSASAMLTLSLCLIKTFMDFDMDQVENILILIEIILKHFTTLLAIKKIGTVLDDVKHFWDLNLHECKILPKYLTLQKVYFMTLMACLPLLAAKPFVVTDSSLFGCYFPEQLPFIVTYLFEVYVITMAIIVIAGQDLTLCFLILTAIEQFHLLNRKLKDINLNQVNSSNDLQEVIIKFKGYVIYHDFLLRYVKKLNDILSIPQLIFMGMSAAILCFCMYNSSLNADSPVLKYRIAFISLSIVSEFLIIYGYPAQVMMDEAAEVGNTLYYNCEWYLPNIKPLRKYILIMLTRSQRPAVISAEGFFEINNATVVLLMKKAYSFYALLRTLE